jgi:DNA repair protein RadA/Sms
VRLSEPAADLGVAAAIASSFLDRPIDPKTVVFGEVGLTGAVRGINQMEIRIREAARMGFARCVLPRTQLRGLDKAGAIELVRVGHLKELLAEIF